MSLGAASLDDLGSMQVGFQKSYFAWQIVFGWDPLLDPWPLPEGSYEIGSVRQSFRLSVSFLGIGALVFSET